MTPLRRRMVEDMKVRRFAGSTQYNYIKCVERLAQHFGRSPERMGPEEVRAFLVYLVTEANVSYDVLCHYISALRLENLLLANLDHPSRSPRGTLADTA